MNPETMINIIKSYLNYSYLQLQRVSAVDVSPMHSAFGDTGAGSSCTI